MEKMKDPSYYHHKDASLEALRGNWGQAIGISFIIFLISFLANFLLESNDSLIICIFSILVAVCIVFPLQVGYSNSILSLIERRDTHIVHNTFHLARHHIIRFGGGMLLMTIYILLWSLLLIIPGIIMSLAYAMTPYILVERPELTAAEAIRESRIMMRGHKMELLMLYVSFLGWILLSVLTCGIGFIFLYPYMQGATGEFYRCIHLVSGPEH